MSKGFLTIAFGEKYRRMANNLLQSYRTHGGKEAFAIVTEEEDVNTKNFDTVIIRKPDRIGFMSKLMIDTYTPYDDTIFIDADCLVGSNIDWWFSKFEENGSHVSVFGWNIDIGTTLSNPENYYFQYRKCSCYNVEYIPSFNGGVYFLKKGEVSSQVFSDARKFVDDKFDGGFLCYGDEPNIALAMAKNKCRCIPHNQILVFPRAKISCINMRTEEYAYEQFGEKYYDLGVIHFGSKNTKRILYKYWAFDNKNRNGILQTILYNIGFFNILQEVDVVRDIIIHFLVIVKHSTVDRILHK